MKTTIMLFTVMALAVSSCASGTTLIPTTAQVESTEMPAPPPITSISGTDGIAGKNDCILPTVVSGYYVGETAPTPIPQKDILPVGWENISKIPDEYKGSYAYIKLVRPMSGFDELWVGVRASNEITDANNIYLIYRTDTNEWSKAPQPPGYDLFLDGNQKVWASVYSTDNSDPRFFLLDDNINQFIPVKDRSNKLGSGNVVGSSIQVGKDGTFWFIFQNNDDTTATHEMLYSFNPITLEANTYSIEENLNSLEIDQNDNLYLVQNGDTLIKFNASTGGVSSVKIPYQDQSFGGTSLYIDHEGRLWVSDRARYDNAVSSPIIDAPFVLIRSPLFIEYAPYLPGYRWERPVIMLESLDGRLWYNGDIWFNTDTGEWCRFTTYSSNIVEDSNRNPWMIADNKLFKLVLNP